jgi:hypothetical protein
MVFHTSPRCNNGMLIHLLSERFALYYTLFSDDMLSLNGISITHGDASHDHLLQCQLIQESRQVIAEAIKGIEKEKDCPFVAMPLFFL